MIFPRDVLGTAVTGKIPFFIRGDRTVAIVPTQDTPRPEATLAETAELDLELAATERDSRFFNIWATRSPEGDRAWR